MGSPCEGNNRYKGTDCPECYENNREKIVRPTIIPNKP